MTQKTSKGYKKISKNFKIISKVNFLVYPKNKNSYFSLNHKTIFSLA